MNKRTLILMAFPALMLLASCSKKEDPAPTTGTVAGTITDLATKSVLSGTKLIVFDANTNSPVGSATTTGTDGHYSISLQPGSYYLKVFKQGYDDIPFRGISAVPFTILMGQSLTNDYALSKSTLANAGYITGKITASGGPFAGVLVVATNGSTGYSSVSDQDGNYTIYNVPANSYSVQGWMGGYNSNTSSATVTASTETSSVNLSMTSGASGSVSGTITFLATGNIEVDVALTHPATHETIPGLTTLTSSGTYSLKNVPSGTFLARASYRNDEKVVDPDWILKNGEPTVTVSTTNAQRDFSVTGALLLSSPTNAASTTHPLTIDSASPTFSWNAYASADDYVIEVTNSNGKVIWGGFSGSGLTLTKNISIPKAQTSITYNSDGNATESLQPGRVYRWKIYASKNDNTTIPAWKLISSSEDQRGIILLPANQ